MKIVRRGVLPVGGDTGLDKMRTIAIAGEFKSPAEAGRARLAARCSTASRRRCCASSTSPPSQPLKVVLDGASGMAGTMLSQVLPRLPIQAIPCYMEPDGSFPAPPAEPAARGEPRVHRRQGARGGRRPRHRLGRRRRPLLLRRRRGRVRAGRLHDGAARRGRAREAPGRHDPLRPARLAGGARHDRALPAAGPCARASATPSSRCGCARRTPSSPARCRATTTSATSTASTPASCRRSCCSSWCRGRAARWPTLIRPLRERYFISGEINTPVRDVALKLQELKDRFGAGRRDLAPRRRLDRLPRLALQRPAVEHRAAPAAESRGVLAGRHGAPARRGARGHQRS